MTNTILGAHLAGDQPINQVVLAVDLGTTAVKVVAVDRGLHGIPLASRDCPLRTTNEQATHDPRAVLTAAITAVQEAVAHCANQGWQVAGLSFSAAMHTLLALDHTGTPVTPALSWADNRAQRVAARLSAEAGEELHRATGTPVHPMSPLTKLAWFAEHQPTPEATTWCGLKDFVLATFTNRLVTDLSCASATGLLAMHTRSWHPPALAAARITPDQLPELVPSTELLSLSPGAATQLGLPAGLPVIAGAGDGPLANLGVGAVRPGIAALSVGTSAALRVARTTPGVDPRCRVFCYYLADDLWVSGGAISNGGLVGQWAADTFANGDLTTLLTEATAVPPGADGLLALPHLLGERAPWWNPTTHGALFGLRARHTRAELTRALLEGVAQQVALVRDSLLDADARIDDIRATGGALRADIWADVLAGALDSPLLITDDSAGSGYGAGLLAWHVLGVLPTLADAADLPRPYRAVQPDPLAAKKLTATRHLTERAYQLARDLAELAAEPDH
jgi:gluconokinase